jgi:hypothetical protein
VKATVLDALQLGFKARLIGTPAGHRFAAGRHPQGNGGNARGGSRDHHFPTAMNLPFHRSYWVEQGSLLAGFYPGDKDPAERDRNSLRSLIAEVNAHHQLDGIRRTGITRVIPSRTMLQGSRSWRGARAMTVRRDRIPLWTRSVPTPA